MPARHEQLQPLGLGEQLAENRRGLVDLLEVVDDQESLPVAEALGQRLERAPRAHLDTEAAAISSGTSSGSRSGARPTKTTPSTNRSVSSCAAWMASRVLPVPPGPVSVTSRESSAEQRDDVLDLSAASDERCRRRGQAAARAQLGRLDVERGVLAEDRRLELLELRARARCRARPRARARASR